MLEIISNGRSKTAPAWDTKSVGTIEDLIEALSIYTLDPAFEHCGNFINNNPHWMKPELQEKYKGCITFFGNFYDCSHVFNIITDDKETINTLTEAINKNKDTKKYKKARNEYLDICTRKEELRIKWMNGEISYKEYNNGLI